MSLLFVFMLTLTPMPFIQSTILPKTNLLKAPYVTSETEDESWGYVTVRPKAHMFWWLYQTTNAVTYKQAPLILWLQGGPGGSSTGFGNFEEIGPLDVNLNPRNTTWLSLASLLFIDNPVGTGYSYVDSDDAYTTDVQMIAADLLTVFSAFLNQNKDFQRVPFYIFSESYGGKMTAAFSEVLWNAVKAKSLVCNFQGLAMGDSWISPLDSTNSWGPFLYVNSLVDRSQLGKVQESAQMAARLAAEGKWEEATAQWSATEDVVETVTSGVNFYNIQQWGGSDMSQAKARLTWLDRAIHRHVKIMQGDDLDQLMNGPIREKLKIIPKNVTWGAQSGTVFQKQIVDFMKPVTDIVDNLISNTSLLVVVYSGQLDLIVDNVGTEAWVYRLNITDEFRKAEKVPLMIRDIPVAFVKAFKNFKYYWILAAGHMVPSDSGPAALAMVKQVVGMA